MNNKNIVSIGDGKNLSVLTDGEIKMIGGGGKKEFAILAGIMAIGGALFYVAAESKKDKNAAGTAKTIMETGCTALGGGSACSLIRVLPEG